MKIDELTMGQELPKRKFTATNVSLFCYNAAIWNPHRIHYDETYTKEVEQHPDIVIDGPLQGDWLSQVVVNWIKEDAQLLEFSYSNRKASYLGETLQSGGKINRINRETGIVDLELFLTNSNGEITTPGIAKIQFPV